MSPILLTSIGIDELSPPLIPAPWNIIAAVVIVGAIMIFSDLKKKKDNNDQDKKEK